MNETGLQIEVAGWLRIWVPEPAEGGPWWTAVNPVPGKSQMAAAQSKAMGMKAGVPDFLFLWRSRLWGVELKLEDGVVREVQRDCHTDITLAGGGVIVCRSLESVQEWARMVGIPVRTPEEVEARRAAAKEHAAALNIRNRSLRHSGRRA